MLGQAGCSLPQFRRTFSGRIAPRRCPDYDAGDGGMPQYYSTMDQQYWWAFSPNLTLNGWFGIPVAWISGVAGRVVPVGYSHLAFYPSSG